jgi:putative membrane protein
MMRGYWYGPQMMDFGSGFGIAGAIVSILFWVAIFFLIVMLFRSFGKHKNEEETEETKDEDTAFQILRERYAKGEITKRQFQDMKKDLLIK